MNRLIALGTGAARATHYYNTCSVLEGSMGSLLVDGGGGNTILTRLADAGVSLSDIADIYVTHEHIDHTLGILWMVRVIGTQIARGKRDTPLRIHCHTRLAEKLRMMCTFTLGEKICSLFGPSIQFLPVRDGEQREIIGHTFTFFDIHSAKAEQYGFKACSPGGQVVVCTGDEPCPPCCEPYVAGADWLLHESFCLDADAGVFHPHAISHGTVKEAALLAERNNVRNLVIWHTEDSLTLGTRKRKYAEEAQEYFHGAVYIPDDLDVIDMGQ